MASHHAGSLARSRRVACALSLGLAIAACAGGGGDGGSDPGTNPGTDPGGTFSISGSVAGSTASGVTMTLSGASTRTAVTGATGSFVFAGLSPGTYRLAPSKGGFSFSPLWRDVTIGSSSHTGEDFSSVRRSLYGVWASAVNDAWAVGEAGTILHWNGSAWSSIESGTMKNLRAVWGSSANDVWAVGVEGTILHWNGSVWSSVASGTTQTLSALWGSSANDVWLVGRVVLHWSGSTWSRVTTSSSCNDLQSVVGFRGSPAPVLAVGSCWDVRQWTGSAWNIVAAGTYADETFTAAWGENPNFWIATGNGLVKHWNGSGWAPDQDLNAQINGLWGSSATDVWAVGAVMAHWNGSTWSTVTQSTMGLWAVWGTSATDVWAVGTMGEIEHWNGGSWSSMSLP